MGSWKPCREQPKAAEIPQSPVEPGCRFSCCYKRRMSEQRKMKVESLGKKTKCGGCQTRTRCQLSATQEWWRSNTFAELPTWKKKKQWEVVWWPSMVRIWRLWKMVTWWRELCKARWGTLILWCAGERLLKVTERDTEKGGRRTSRKGTLTWQPWLGPGRSLPESRVAEHIGEEKGVEMRKPRV